MSDQHQIAQDQGVKSYALVFHQKCSACTAEMKERSNGAYVLLHDVEHELETLRAQLAEANRLMADYKRRSEFNEQAENTALDAMRNRERQLATLREENEALRNDAGWISIDQVPAVDVGDYEHFWVAAKRDSGWFVFIRTYANLPVSDEDREAWESDGGEPHWALRDQDGNFVSMVGWCERMHHPEYSEFYEDAKDPEVLFWKPMHKPLPPTEAAIAAAQVKL